MYFVMFILLFYDKNPGTFAATRFRNTAHACSPLLLILGSYRLDGPEPRFLEIASTLVKWRRVAAKT